MNSIWISNLNLFTWFFLTVAAELSMTKLLENIQKLQSFQKCSWIFRLMNKMASLNKIFSWLFGGGKSHLFLYFIPLLTMVSCIRLFLFFVYIQSLDVKHWGHIGDALGILWECIGDAFGTLWKQFRYALGTL